MVYKIWIFILFIAVCIFTIIGRDQKKIIDNWHNYDWVNDSNYSGHEVGFDFDSCGEHNWTTPYGIIELRDSNDLTPKCYNGNDRIDTIFHY